MSARAWLPAHSFCAAGCLPDLPDPLTHAFPLPPLSLQYYVPAGEVYVLMGPRLCVVSTGSTDVDTPIVQYSGTATCVVPNEEAGRAAFSITLQDPTYGYGLAALDSWLTQVSPVDGASYLYVQHGDISGLSSNTGGLLGGTVLTITGTGFAVSDPTANTVLVAGQPCAVVSVTATSLQCTIPASTPASATVAGTLYPGGRGLLWQLWNMGASNSLMTTFFTTAAANAPPAQSGIITSGAVGVAGRTSISNLVWYAESLTGFIVPPYNATYTFYLGGDDWQELALSKDASPAGLAVIASMYSYNVFSNPYWLSSSQISSPRNLTGGKPYYFRVRHTQGNGLDWVRVAVRITGAPAAGPLLALSPAPMCACVSTFLPSCPPL